MPHLRVIASGGASARRLVAEELEALSKKGRAFAGTHEGGEWPALIAAGRSAGLFDDKRVSVVESAELLGPFPDELLPYLEGDDASEVLLLVFEKEPGKTFSPAAKKKIVQIKGESVPFWSAQRKKWLLDLAGKEGVALSDDAAALLVELLEDPEECAPNCSLVLPRTGPVDAGMVKDSHSTRAEHDAQIPGRVLPGAGARCYRAGAPSRSGVCFPCSPDCTTEYAPPLLAFCSAEERGSSALEIRSTR